MGFFPTDVGAQLLVKRGLQEHEPADDTDKPGVGVNRLGAQSGVAVLCGTFTTGGNGTGTAKVTLAVKHSDEDDNYDDDLVTPEIYDIVCGSDGIANYCFVLPLNLAGAQKWIRVDGKLNKNDLGTITVHTMSAILILGGLVEKPDAAYNKDGYVDHDLSGVEAG